MFSGGAPRIGDLFEFIHQFYVDSEYTKTGIPLNVVLISDGQTQGDDKENMEKWTKILKRVSTSGLIKAYFRFTKNIPGQLLGSFIRVFLDFYKELRGWAYAPKGLRLRPIKNF